MAASTSSAAAHAPRPACKHLVLDAGPLLSLSPLRGLSETYYTVPQVLDELKDKRAREHFERLGLSAGVRIEVKAPSTASVAHVIQWAKKTGDYAVLSHPDMCVLALTYELDQQEKELAEKAKASAEASAESGQVQEDGEKQITSESASNEAPESQQPTAQEDHTEAGEQKNTEDVLEEIDSNPDDVPPPSESEDEESQEEHEEGEPLSVELEPLQNELSLEASSSSSPPPSTSDPAPASTFAPPAENEPLYDDPSDEDDGEGEWITPSNVALHKSRALDLLPSAGDSRKGKKQQERILVGCMTADFAMQNVLLQMGLGLVGVEGKRIERVKSWVLRCHACFKICKDASRKFCPSCGNPTLLRASVTISSPTAGPNTPAMQVHLKKNFQFKTRGTIYSIPAPKPGSAKTGPGEGLILREDQTAWQRAKKRADGKREREEKRMLSAASQNAEAGRGAAVVSSWMDPDWVPEILSAGVSGKGRSMRARGYEGDMPAVGYGRKNPNERRRKK
ncbi:Nin one binding Zn-ribbon like-domain-containing protein [Trametes elegans]|nr:Nin one binding Zn-ribbon like-domain-containing protein [Trametes elegans]